jgi:hypothetical protein
MKDYAICAIRFAAGNVAAMLDRSHTKCQLESAHSS